MSETVTLLTVEYHSDDDTGIYQVGEVDFGIRTGLLEDYIRRDPYNRKKDLLDILGYLIHKVSEVYEKIQSEDDSSKAASVT